MLANLEIIPVGVLDFFLHIKHKLNYKYLVTNNKFSE